ncbi:MAG: hypothetical protein DHS80DRAFT_16229 [Piptocephalis tieghemiana]|nr:MAG: hypothetical protein DHS80DRAFT_16229 [Piptocephalis tieghemiana]
MPQGSMDEEEEEEEDMFAEEDRKPISQKGKYLSQEDIEGQAMDPSVMDNEENAIPLEPFNVRAEMEEGAFKEDGTYVRDAPDPEARHDVWLQGMASTDVISEAKEAQDRREKEARMNETRSRQEALDPQEAQAILARLLQPGETPLKAMRRLGGTGKSKSWKDRIKKQKDVTMDDVGMDRAKLLSDLTRTCDQLLSSGMLDVYEKTQEDFALASTPAPSSTGGARWEFRWSSEDTTIHGPYSDEEMEAWRIQGYFGSEVCVRRVNTGDEGGEGRWLSVDQVDFD